MKIGIVAAHGSAQARSLGDRLERACPGCVVSIDPAVDPADRAVLNQDDLAWNGQRLDHLAALYLHGFSYQDPVVPPADPVCDWTLWHPGAVIAQQKYSFVYSLLSRLEATAVRLYNPVSAHLAAFGRFGLLGRLAAAGHLIPDLLLSNDDDAVGAFLDAHPAADAAPGTSVTAVWRPATGGASWQRFGARQRRHLVGVDRPPVLLAAVTPGPLLRVYCLDGEVALVLMAAPPDRSGLERLETFLPVAADRITGLDGVGPAVAALGCRWAMASIVASPAGPVFYDIDPDPVLADLAGPHRDYLLAALAATLLGQTRPAPPDAVALARPALLLRRMLAIQFDIEATKHLD